MLNQISPSEPLHLGQVSITIDHDEFIDAIGYGIMCYFETDENQRRQMSAQELLDDFKETLSDTTTPLPWRIGFLIGELAGLLNPDLDECDPTLTYLESLSSKYQRLYE